VAPCPGETGEDHGDSVRSEADGMALRRQTSSFERTTDRVVGAFRLFLILEVDDEAMANAGRPSALA